MARDRRDREQQAIENNFKQREMDIQQARAHREDRLADQQERQNAVAAIDHVRTMLDPRHPNYNPNMASAYASAYGVQLHQTPQQGQAPTAPGPAPTAPEVPSFVGPLQTQASPPPAQPSIGGIGAVPDAAMGAFRRSNAIASAQPGATRDSVDAANDASLQQFGRLMPNQAQTAQPGISGQASANAPDPETVKHLAERDQYQTDLATYPQRVADHNDQVEAYQKARANWQAQAQSPTYDMTTPFGTTHLDFGQIHQAQQAQRDEQGTRLAAAFGGDKYGQMAAQLMGMPGADAGQVLKMVVQEREKDAQLQERRDTSMTGDQKFQVGMRPRGGAGAGAAAGAHGKAWQKDETELGKELQSYGKDMSLVGDKGMGTHLRDLDSAYQEAQQHPNGQQQLQILDKMIRAATGLGVRNQTLQLYASHLGGTMTQLRNALSQGASGRLSDDAWNTVTQTLGSNLSDLRREAGAENQHFWNTYGEAAQAHPDLVKRRERELFSGMPGYGQQAAPPAANPLTRAAKGQNLPPGAVMGTKGGKRGYQTPDGVFHEAQ
jgi:hypothetical protein